MTAVFKKELKGYFHSPVAYVCIGVLLALCGYFYTGYVLMSGTSSNIPYVYSNLFMICMLIIPILTMRTFSEERRSKTDQALLTAPVSSFSLVAGKALAAYSVYAIASTLCLIPAVVVTFIGSPNWGMIFGNYVGQLLYGAALTAIGVFVSSLTVNPIVAAIGSAGVAFILMIIDQLGSMLNNEVVSKVVTFISFSSRYNAFTNGTFDVPATVYFLTVAVAFLFLTSRGLESRRWN